MDCYVSVFWGHSVTLGNRVQIHLLFPFVCYILLWILICNLSVTVSKMEDTKFRRLLHSQSHFFSWMVFCSPSDSFSLSYLTASDNLSLLLLFCLPALTAFDFFSTFLSHFFSLLICWLICILHSLVLYPSANRLVLPYASTILAF